MPRRRCAVEPRARVGRRRSSRRSRTPGSSAATTSSPACSSATAAPTRSAATDVPAPPEPCPLPAVACAIEPAARTGDAPRPARTRVGDWRTSWSGTEYAAAVDAVRAAIAEGDVYQVNLVQHLCAEFDGDPAGLAAALAPLRPLEPEPLAGDGLDDRLGVAGAAALAPRLARAHDADQGHAAERRSDRVGEGRGRARDDRRPRAQRPLARLRAGERPLAGAARASASSPASRTSSRRSRAVCAPEVTLTELLEAVLPGRLGHRLPEDRGARPDRRARAGRPRRLDGRARARSTRTAISTSR